MTCIVCVTKKRSKESARACVPHKDLRFDVGSFARELLRRRFGRPSCSRFLFGSLKRAPDGCKTSVSLLADVSSYCRMGSSARQHFALYIHLVSPVCLKTDEAHFFIPYCRTNDYPQFIAPTETGMIPVVREPPTPGLLLMKGAPSGT